MSRTTVATALVFLSSMLAVWNTSAAWAQQPSQQAPSGTGGGVDAATANNPTARLDQVQLQSWYNPSYIDEQGQGNEFLFQPILSFDGKGLIPSSIERLTVPLESLPNGRTGLGDTSLIAEFFPGYHHQKIKVGFGPAIVGPSATNRFAGDGQWQVGPSLVAVYTGVPKLIVGAILSNPITVTGERSRPGVNSLTLEPLVTKVLPKEFFIRFDPYWNFNWKEHGSATLPLLLGIGRLVKVGGQAMNLYVEPEVLARHPPYPGNNPSRITIKFDLSLLYPIKDKQ